MNTASNPNPTIVTFTEFKTQVMTGQLLSVTLYPDRIDYQLKGQFGVTYRTVVKDENRDDLQVVTNALRQQGVPFKAAIDSANPPSVLGGIVSLLLSAGLAAGTWWWLSKFVEDNGSGGDIGNGFGNSFGNSFGNGFSNPMGMGRSKARAYADGKSTQKITFADVAGIHEAKQELQEIVDFLKDGEKYRKIGAKIPKGVLLVGPPGTGKTLLAKAIAGEAGVPFFSMAGSEFVELYVGVGASRVRDLFQKAKRQAPCIIFIDEIDAIGKSRNNNPGGNDEREQTLNQLLTEMDGFDGNAGVILVAATNRPEILDAALKRPGRFDRQVLVDRPDKLGRLEILKVHARSVLLGEDVDLDAIATQTAGFVGADLANLINESALLAARYNRQAVLMQDVQAAIERVIAGLENRSRILSPIERQTVAYHEVGHAIVGAAVTGGGRVTKISIVPRGAGALGYTLQMPEEDRFLMMEDELQGRIATLLGGRSAEELIFGQVSTGASDDIQKATDLAERAVTQYGMSKTLGPIAFEKTQGQFLDQGTVRRNVSNEVSAEIDRLVKQTIDQAHQRAQAILTANRELLESTTQLLLKEEVLEGDRLAEILASVVR